MENPMLTLVFDGYCRFCMRAVVWIAARVPAGRLTTLPSQTPGLLERFELSQAQVDREVWVIDEAGRRYPGAAGINRMLEEVPGFWGWLGRSYRLRPIGWLEDRVYAWVASNRSLFRFLGVTPACERPGATCVDDPDA